MRIKSISVQLRYRAHLVDLKDLRERRTIAYRYSMLFFPPFATIRVDQRTRGEDSWLEGWPEAIALLTNSVINSWRCRYSLQHQRLN
jgi:hypothetical protein